LLLAPRSTAFENCPGLNEDEEGACQNDGNTAIVTTGAARTTTANGNREVRSSAREMKYGRGSEMMRRRAVAGSTRADTTANAIVTEAGTNETASAIGTNATVIRWKGHGTARARPLAT